MAAPGTRIPEELILAALTHAPLPARGATPADLARSLAALGVEAIARDDPRYPQGWRELDDAPPVLFRHGGALPALDDAVAIVGSRAATPYGLRVARRLAGDLAAAGVTVVSGLARGIDAAAHEGALESGGHTVAVLPSGLDAIAPAHHEALARRIATRGALVSERASGPPPHRAVFVQRNRLIAALAAVTVVVEASATSGALHTARAARRLGRVLMAVPGDIDREVARGTLDLLRDGARPCADAGDVLAALASRGAAGEPERPLRASRPRRAAHEPAPSAVTGSDPVTRRLWAALAAGGSTVETLAAAAGLSVGETQARLLSLEWAGLARRVAGGRWRAGRT